MNDKLQRLSAALTAAPPPSTAPDTIRVQPQDITIPFQRHASEEPEPPGGLSLREYWKLLHARRGTIAVAIGLGVIAAAVFNYIQVPTYRASATIQIDREERNIADLGDERQLPEPADYIETQYKVLRSRTLARQVVHQLGLYETPEFRGEDEITATGDTFAAVLSPDDIHPRIVDRFLENLSVSPGKGTRLVDVGFETVDRELAPQVVNRLADVYIEHNLAAKWNATQKASGWLQQQLKTLQTRLEQSEAALHDYAAAHSILFVEERKNITTEKLAQLEDELTRAEAARIDKQSMAMLAEDAIRRGQKLPGSLGSDRFDALQKDLAEMRREQSQLLVTFAPGYPKVQRVQRQIDELERALDAERERILSGVREEFALAQQREVLLRSASLEQRALVNRLSDDFIEYNILKRDAETTRELYEGLLQRLKEAGVSAGLRASNIAVLDPAELPQKPYRPKKLVNYGAGLLAGLCLGIVFAFVQEHMNTTVRTPEEVENMTGLGMLAIIPRSRGKHERKVITNPSTDHLLSSATDDGEGKEVSLWEPEEGLAEAYRTLRSSVLLGWDEAMKRILVTSAQPQEGKTTVSLNLACSLAQLRRRVLLIDADMRRPNCDKQLGLKAEKGLNEYLQGLAELDEVIIDTPVPGLSLLPAGKSNRLASDLLYSPRLASLLLDVGRRYEHVVVDSPPSLAMSDARTISRMVEGVILIVSDTTDRNSLMRTKQTLDAAGVRFLGFVMNRVNLNNMDYGYYRDYGYYYNYTDEPDKKSRKKAS